MSTENTVLPCIAEHSSRFSEASRFAERQANQQRILAELGMRALSGASLDDLMAAIPRWVCDSLGTQYCNIFQMLSGEERLLLRASCDLAQAQVGKAIIPMTKNTQPGNTVANGHPVIVEDFASKTRFERTRLDTCDRVTSGMSVTIFQSKARPWGVLTACARERMSFSADGVSFFQGMANMLGLVLERFRQQDGLRNRKCSRMASVSYKNPLPVVRSWSMCVTHSTSSGNR